MRNLVISILGVAVFVIVAGLVSKNYLQKNIPSTLNKFVETPKKTIFIGSLRLEVELANTEELRQKGLSQKTKLNPDEGMLFIFDQKDIKPIFWMKNKPPSFSAWLEPSKSAVYRRLTTDSLNANMNV